MNWLKTLDTIGSFMQTNGDKATFERVGGKLIAKLFHNGAKRSFVQYGTGTVVETIVHKRMKG